VTERHETVTLDKDFLLENLDLDSSTSSNGQPQVPESTATSDVQPPKKKQVDVRKSREDSLQVLRFLNLKTGRSFREVPSNLQLIASRLREGASVQDCKGVISRKWREWRDNPEMVQFVRPATLFNRLKFEQYLGQQGMPAGREEGR
jgi:uncharacterized phage protein (TIGR02220 family)